MEFNQQTPIYLQIADAMCEKILSGIWPETERIPSVREVGMQLGVNPNTVARSYETLQRRQIILNKRGVGFFVAAGAIALIRNDQKEAFLHTELPRFFKKMDLLGIHFEDLHYFYDLFKQDTQ